MKHPWKITAILLFLFLAAQVVGLSLLSLNIKEIRQTEEGQLVEHGALAFGARPETYGFASLLYLAIGVAVGTALVLILIRLRAFRVWKAWFLLAVWLSTAIALSVIMPATAALILCLALAAWKVFWPNPVIHNLTEVVMYAGIAILLVPIFSLFWAVMLLAVISVYDMIAVWYSKHMVVMAEAQTKSNLFAGLFVPKKTAEGAESVVATKILHSQETIHVEMPNVPLPSAPGKSSAAILGGGDIAFPLIFSGVAMDWLIINGAARTEALLLALIITVTTTVSLALLFMYARKDRFYPAMPFLSLGCLLGLGVIALL